MTTEAQENAWETETGLPNDIDAWMSDCKFGMKDDYAKAITDIGAEGSGLMFMFDLMDEKGEIQGSQGYSIGTGWIVSDDGLSISHPKRHNVVGSSMYGTLQNRVVKELGVDMASRGSPLEAKVWEGLGFHWLQQPHSTVSGEEKMGLMPITVLDAKAGAPATTPAAGESVADKVAAAKAKLAAGKAGAGTADLVALAKANELADFQAKALEMADVASNDELMASVLDDGPDGFWAVNHG